MTEERPAKKPRGFRSDVRPKKGYKRCPRCMETKHLNGFHRHKSKPDGRQSYCRKCQIHAVAKGRLANPEKAREQNRRYDQETRRWEAAKATFKRSTPEKKACHARVQKALHQGLLKRPDRCSVCKEECRPEAHHPDYSKPLQVVWVCRPCHRSIHAGLNGKIPHRILAMKQPELYQ